MSSRKVVVITGAASGIGRGIMERYTQEEHIVVAVDRDLPALNSLLDQQIRPTKIKLCDISDTHAMSETLKQICAEFGQIDIFIANAGISIRHRFLDVSEDDFDATANINFRGTFFSCQQAARIMLEQEQGGVILVTGSINGLAGFSNYSPYNATKAALINMVKTMALELPAKIRTACISPGAVWTPMQEREYSKAMKDEIDGQIPIGRHATPEELAEFYYFFGTQAGPFARGCNIVVDGGETSGRFDR